MHSSHALCLTDHSHIWIRFHSSPVRRGVAQTFVSHYALGPACPGEHSDIGKENGLFVFFYPGLKPLPFRRGGAKTWHAFSMLPDSNYHSF